MSSRRRRSRNRHAFAALGGCATAAALALGLASTASAQAPGAPVLSTSFEDCATGDNQFRTPDGERSWYTNPGCDSYREDVYERPTNQGHRVTTIAARPPAISAYLSGLAPDATFPTGATVFSTSADYYEYTDITRGFTGFDAQWMYVRIELFGTAKVDKGDGSRDTDDFASGTHYNVRIGTEADPDRANGGILLEVQNSKDVPLGRWTTADTHVWADSDRSVSRAGGVNVPREGDGNGYEQSRDNRTAGNGYLYVRRVNTTFSGPGGTVQRPAFDFAFNYAKYNRQVAGADIRPGAVTYLVLDASRGLKGHATYLWNDRYSFAEAGSPNGADQPQAGEPQNIYEVDTLRAGFGSSGGAPVPGSPSSPGASPGPGAAGGEGARPARLTITAAAPRRARTGQRFVQTIRVRNTGRQVARNVVVTNVVPRHLAVARVTPRGVTRGRTVRVRLGNIAPGRTRIVRVLVRADAAPGRRVAVVTATSTNTPRVRTRAVTQVVRPR